MAPQVWLVTGCSTGFGEHFIRAILDRGDKAIATARRLESIKFLADLGAATLQLDVTDSEEVLKGKLKEANDIYGRIDVLVNNAGYGYISSLEDIEIDRIKAQFETNVWGPLKLTKLITPYFRAQKGGVNVVVSSIASLLAIPCMGAYSSSKAAVDGLMKAWAQEVKPLGIKTLILQPGSYRTNIREPTRGAQAMPQSSEHYQGMYDHFMGIMETTHDKQDGDPRRFADLAIDMVKEEGLAKDKEIPLAIPTGAEALAAELPKREKELKELQDWESVLVTTDFPEKAAGAPEVSLTGFGDAKS